MANLIKPPLLDETGKAILAALLGEEPAEQSGSQIRPPMSDETGKAILEAIKALSPQPAPLVVTFSGTSAGDDAACDKTWSQIQAAGKNVEMWYVTDAANLWKLNASFSSNFISGYMQKIDDMADPGSAYVNISCSIDSENHVSITYEDV